MHTVLREYGDVVKNFIFLPYIVVSAVE